MPRRRNLAPKPTNRHPQVPQFGPPSPQFGPQAGMGPINPGQGMQGPMPMPGLTPPMQAPMPLPWPCPDPPGCRYAAPPPPIMPMAADHDAEAAGFRAGHAAAFRSGGDAGGHALSAAEGRCRSTGRSARPRPPAVPPAAPQRPIDELESLTSQPATRRRILKKKKSTDYSKEIIIGSVVAVAGILLAHRLCRRNEPRQLDRRLQRHQEGS